MPKNAPITSGSLVCAIDIEDVHSHASQDGSTLVARLAPNGGLYVFERAGTFANMYITCSLQPWLLESRVIAQSLGTASLGKNDIQLLLNQHNLAVATRPVPGAFSRTPKKPKDRRGALARLSILPERVTTVGNLPEIDPRPETSARPPASFNTSVDAGAYSISSRC